MRPAVAAKYKDRSKQRTQKQLSGTVLFSTVIDRRLKNDRESIGKASYSSEQTKFVRPNKEEL